MGEWELIWGIGNSFGGSGNSFGRNWNSFRGRGNSFGGLGTHLGGVETHFREDSWFVCGLCMPGKKTVFKKINLICNNFTHIFGLLQARMIIHDQNSVEVKKDGGFCQESLSLGPSFQSCSAQTKRSHQHHQPRFKNK